MSNTLKLGNGKWATGKDTVLAYNDLNSNYKPLPFSFSRDSSATVVNKDGLIETVGSGEPRIDFKDNTKGALLLEPSRTNYIPYSTLDFNGGVKPNGWSIGFGTGSYSYEQLEYKGQKAVKQTQITTGRSYLDTGSITILANTEHTLKIQFILDECIADANDNVVAILGFGINVNYQFSDIDENGILELQYNPLSDNIGNIRIGLGSIQNEDGGKSLAWAIPQLEQGSYATSYIPTSGQANGVTRVQDLVVGIDTLQDLSLLGSNEGTWLVDMKDMFFEITGTGVGSMYLYQDNTNQIEFVAKSNTTCKITINNSTALDNIGGENKIAISWDANGLVIYKNGVAAYTTSSTEYSNPYTHLFLVKNTRQSKKQINNTQLYNTRLSNSELAALTS